MKLDLIRLVAPPIDSCKYVWSMGEHRRDKYDIMFPGCFEVVTYFLCDVHLTNK